MHLCTVGSLEPARRVCLRHGIILLHYVLLIGWLQAAFSITPPCEPVSTSGAVTVYQSCRWPSSSASSEALYIESAIDAGLGSSDADGAVPSILASSEASATPQSESGTACVPMECSATLPLPLPCPSFEGAACETVC